MGGRGASSGIKNKKGINKSVKRGDLELGEYRLISFAEKKTTPKKPAKKK